MPLDTIKISKNGRDQLLTLKRRTKIGTWNVLCRWGLCVSLAEASVPRAVADEHDNVLEIELSTLFGEYQGVYLALLKSRCKQDGLDLDDETLHVQLRLHVHRGISYLAGLKDMSSIRELCTLPLAGRASGDSRTKKIKQMRA